MNIEIASIILDDATRQRQDMGSVEELQELAMSLRDIGLLNPIIINRENKLLAGRRRIEAAKALGWTHIKCEYFEDLDPIRQKIVELDENRKRKQLTWQEEAAAIAIVHEMKKESDRKWSMEDTASALGVSVAKVSEDLTLAGALLNERVSKRPSRRGALETVKRERELELVRELARRRAASIVVDPSSISTVLTGGVVYNDDCRAVLSKMDPNSVDLIVTDPPWGIDFNESSQWAKRWVATYDDDPNEIRLLLKDVIPLMFRVLKPASHVYCFMPIQELAWWLDHFTQAGFIMRTRPLVWFKTGQPSITDTYTSFLPCYEVFLWGWKPGVNDVRRFFSKPIPEGFGLPRQPGLYHENEKPVEMLERYIETSCEINEVVLDPFAGGASTLAAAFSLGRYYIGIEKDIVNYNKTLGRLKELEHAKYDTSEGERPA